MYDQHVRRQPPIPGRRSKLKKASDFSRKMDMTIHTKEAGATVTYLVRDKHIAKSNIRKWITEE